jgi:hypothetical protein
VLAGAAGWALNAELCFTQTEGVWQWADGSAVSYTNWWQLGPGEVKNMRPPNAIPDTQPNGLEGAGEDGAVAWL